MRKWTKTAGLLFLATASVYSSQAIAVAAGGRATPPTEPASDVRLLDAADPFATAPAAADAPTTAPTTAPAPTEGTSINGSDVNMSDIGTVEIHVSEANLVDVLRMLSLQSQRNIIASKDVRGTVTANLYDVTVNEALDAILAANGYGYRERGNLIYVYTQKEIEEMEKAERRMQTRVFRLYHTPAANATTLIKPVLSEDGEVAASTPSLIGIPNGTGNTGGDTHAVEDTLVVTDYPENLDRVAEVIAELDRRPQQILLEATILRATLDEDNAFGVDFNVLSGVDFSTFNSSSGQINNANIGDGAVGDNPNSVGTGNNFTNDINGGFRFGVVTDSVSVFVSALEQVTDTTILANPKVLALNKQRGEVFVGNEEGYRTTITTETSTTETVESLKTGTRLLFRPFIGAEGYIRMEVHPEDSSGQVNAAGLPEKTTTEVTSNIMVKDGHTIVIGGLFREVTVSGRNQIPILGNIPIAGYLFGQQRDRTVREEVIILLTPHIIKSDETYSELSQEQLEMAEQYRVGVRKGLMPWGRERMADSSYQKAKEALDGPRPNRKKALWHLNSATNLNPSFGEAIALKEQISGREITTSDGSSIRDFVRVAVLEDQLPVPPAEVEPEVEDQDEQDEALQNDLGAFAPATQPVAAVPATQPVAEAPTTQPVAADEVALEPVIVEDFTAEEPVVQETFVEEVVSDEAELMEVEVVELPAEEPQAIEEPSFVEAPATQPAVTTPAESAESADTFAPLEITVTELPLGEAVESYDDSK